MWTFILGRLSRQTPTEPLAVARGAAACVAAARLLLFSQPASTYSVLGEPPISSPSATTTPIPQVVLLATVTKVPLPHVSLALAAMWIS